jgi:hypothetical protein
VVVQHEKCSRHIASGEEEEERESRVRLRSKRPYLMNKILPIMGYLSGLA